MLPASEHLYEGLQRGINYADTLQPDLKTIDPFYWAHSARFEALRSLRKVDPDGWELRPLVANSGIHLLVQGLHKTRVVKAADGMVRAPGSSGKQMRDYVGIQTQLLYDMGEGLFLPALSLLVDWQLDVDREPIVHLSLPIQPWRYWETALVHWRVPLPPGGAVSLTDMVFDPGGDEGDVMEVVIDPAESGTE